MTACLVPGYRLARCPPASRAFAAALRGEPCRIIGPGAETRTMPTWRWRWAADAGDHELLRRCHGATVDIGCGPGRMTHALLSRGVTALGIDVVHEAIRQTRARGGMALRRDVFSALPGEGRWATALLADGNIGIAATRSDCCAASATCSTRRDVSSSTWPILVAPCGST